VQPGERLVLQLSICEVYCDAVRDLLAGAATDRFPGGHSGDISASGGGGGEYETRESIAAFARPRVPLAAMPSTGKNAHAAVGKAAAGKAGFAPQSAGIGSAKTRGGAGSGEIVELAVTEPDEALACIAGAVSRRASGATACNSRSSRSHCIIRMRLVAFNGAIDARGGAGAAAVCAAVSGRTISTVSVVDLAGNERVRESRVTGTALEEACAVNKSLSALAECISALVRGAAFVPFRSSTLTRQLEPGLTGDARVLVVVNVSAVPLHREQTLSTLQFAAKMAGTPVTRPPSGKLRSALERLCET
jgi:hypothetical protein